MWRRTAPETAWIRLHPNPIDLDGAHPQTVTVSWSAEGAEGLEVHVNGPDGPLFSRSGSAGSQQAVGWVTSGTTFHLQDVSKGQQLSPRHTLATAEVVARFPSGRLGFSMEMVGDAVRRLLSIEPLGISVLPTHTDALVCDVRHAGGSVVLKAPAGTAAGLLKLEAWACDTMRDCGIPAPRVLALDTSLSLLPRSFLIRERVEGDPLDRILLARSGRTDRLLHETGALLRRLHGVTGEGAGLIDAASLTNGRIRGCAETWRAAAARDVAWSLPFLERTALVASPAADRIRQFVDANTHLLDAPAHSLLHGDFLSRHVFADAAHERVTGFIDCEDVRIGDPAFDFACFQLSAGDDPLHLLLDGYGANANGQRDLRERIAFYRLVHSLVGARVFSEAGRPALAAQIVETIRHHPAISGGRTPATGG